MTSTDAPVTDPAAPTAETPTAAERTLGLGARLVALVADGDADPALRELAADVLDVVTMLRDQRDEAVGAVTDLVANYAADDEQAFKAAHDRACRVMAGAR